MTDEWNIRNHTETLARHYTKNGKEFYDVLTGVEVEHLETLHQKVIEEIKPIPDNPLFDIYGCDKVIDEVLDIVNRLFGAKQ